MSAYNRKRSAPMAAPVQERAKAGSSAAAALESLLDSGFKPERLDQLNDMLRLMGVVLGNLALLKVVTDPLADAKAVVSAARALIAIKETPDAIAERLRASSLAHLSVPQLKAIISKVSEANDIQGVDLQSLIEEAKKPASNSLQLKGD